MATCLLSIGLKSQSRVPMAVDTGAFNALTRRVMVTFLRIGYMSRLVSMPRVAV